MTQRHVSHSQNFRSFTKLFAPLTREADARPTRGRGRRWLPLRLTRDGALEPPLMFGLRADSGGGSCGAGFCAARGFCAGWEGADRRRAGSFVPHPSKGRGAEASQAPPRLLAPRSSRAWLKLEGSPLPQAPQWGSARLQPSAPQGSAARRREAAALSLPLPAVAFWGSALLCWKLPPSWLFRLGAGLPGAARPGSSKACWRLGSCHLLFS